jgi:hypothetical protein
MAIFIGFSVVLLVLIMIFAMALAEWADKDLGDLLSGWLKKRPASQPTPVKSTAAPAVKPEAMPAAKGKTASPKKKSAPRARSRKR